MENKKSARYLAYDALKGLKEAILDIDEFTTKERYPHSTYEKREVMDIVLYRSYLRKEMILISYYNKGKVFTIEDVITKVDPINHKVTLLSHGILHMAKIVELKGKND